MFSEISKVRRKYISGIHDEEDSPVDPYKLTTEVVVGGFAIYGVAKFCTETITKNKVVPLPKQQTSEFSEDLKNLTKGAAGLAERAAHKMAPLVMKWLG